MTPDRRALWVVFLMPDSETWKGRCPFCPDTAQFTVPADWPQEKFEEWLADNHLPVHVSDDAREAGPTPMCGRCSRYARAMVATDSALHRKCFEIDCFCGCSRKLTYAKETS